MKPHDVLGSRIFELDDQVAFAVWSGDSNPIHVNPIAARRTQMGQPVVHGVHALLWALDSLCTRMSEPIAAIACEFVKPMYLNERLDAVFVDRKSDTIRLNIAASANLLCKIKVRLGAANTAPEPPDHQAEPDCRLADHDLDDLVGLSGVIALSGRPAIEPEFPQLTKLIGGERVEALAACSAVIGMRCPGLHSILSELTISLVETKAPTARLAWRTIAVDERFRAVTVGVAGSGIAGTLEARVRRAPTRQASVAEVAALVVPQEFSDARALIVGGSRGMGEVAAKILGAGGAEVLLTYSRGKDDAEAVAATLTEAGFTATAAHFDVQQPDYSQIIDAFDPTHIFYFATPAIFPRKADHFDSTLFRRYTEFYVEVFAQMVEQAQGRSTQPVRLLYPSSTAVIERPRGMTEYATAKVAGETLCGDLDRFGPSIFILAERFPRMQTDQTATVMNVPSEPPLPLLLDSIRRTFSLAGGL